MYFSMLLSPTRNDLHHLVRRCGAGVLVLPGDEALLIIHHDMSGKHIAKCCLALVKGTGLAQFGFRVLWGDFNIEFFNLLVADPGHTTPGDQQIAIVIFGINQTQHAVADAADHRFAVSVVGIADLVCQHGRITKIIGCAPTTSQEDNVVVGEINVVDLYRLLDLGCEDTSTCMPPSRKTWEILRLISEP